MKKEYEAQIELVNLLALYGITVFHIPNGEHRPAKTGAKLKAMGVCRGVPDLMVTTPVPGRPEIRGVFIEMKSERGTVSPEQAEWHRNLRKDGYEVIVARGASDGYDQLRAIGLLPG